MELLMVALALMAGLVLPDDAWWCLTDAQHVSMDFAFLCVAAPRRWQSVAVRVVLYLSLAKMRWETAWDLPPDGPLMMAFILLVSLTPGPAETPLERALRRLSGPLLLLLALGLLTGRQELMVVQFTLFPVFLFRGFTAVLNILRARIVRRWRQQLAALRFRVRAGLHPIQTATLIRELYLQ